MKRLCIAAILCLSVTRTAQGQDRVIALLEKMDQRLDRMDDASKRLEERVRQLEGQGTPSYSKSTTYTYAPTYTPTTSTTTTYKYTPPDTPSTSTTSYYTAPPDTPSTSTTSYYAAPTYAPSTSATSYYSWSTTYSTAYYPNWRLAYVYTSSGWMLMWVYVP